ncbi:hypothetical protein ABT297_42955 [Dactylosporangium sp. NPDC000555]|uniref:hypothetical protein n=1 Tax=Dactylosporangium sp. NPDC000555 TaxID=3154260 RepID=UPI0033280948
MTSPHAQSRMAPGRASAQYRSNSMTLSARRSPACIAGAVYQSIPGPGRQAAAIPDAPSAGRKQLP